eukprot:TRINITY_DN9210_c0_g2_i1.p1 TRINITY_DN9210_c0_g2~~TRINITY_DN9210_c0_g2_i1.p1  ORF type:complete len:350 (+),score=45.93 TRINITY_DN9210_c0_g2_i1:173-1222(+)
MKSLRVSRAARLLPWLCPRKHKRHAPQPCPRIRALSEPVSDGPPNSEGYKEFDRMAYARWGVTREGVRIKLPDYDFLNPSWMQYVHFDLGWNVFWELFEELTEGDLAEVDYDEATPQFMPSGREAIPKSLKRMLALEAQHFMMNTPGFVSHGIDMQAPDIIPEPEKVERERIDQLSAFDLRAKREKTLWREESDFMWQCIVQDSWHSDQIVMDDRTDIRLQERIRGERYDWTPNQIWDVITNNGVSVDPFIVRESRTFKVQNPLYIQDWASQGITYVDEMEDWIEKQGRLGNHEMFEDVINWDGGDHMPGWDPENANKDDADDTFFDLNSTTRYDVFDNSEEDPLASLF